MMSYVKEYEGLLSGVSGTTVSTSCILYSAQKGEESNLCLNSITYITATEHFVFVKIEFICDIYPP